jgi:broad specificity phosphatase PhoE
VTTVILVRHGQASFGAANYDQLSPLGERQAQALGGHWQAGGFSADRAYSGSLQRQRKTGEHALAVIGGRAPAQLDTDAAFNEFNHTQLIRAYLPLVAGQHPELADDPHLAMRDQAVFRPVFNTVVGAWMRGEQPSMPIDETWLAFCARCVAGLRRAAEGSERLVVFTSGGVITAVMREALGLDDPKSLELVWKIWNASVHEFQIHPEHGGLALAGFNDVSHLRLQGDSAIITRI